MNNQTILNRHCWSRIKLRGLATLFLLFFLILTISACEAPLDLSSVNIEMGKPTHRADLFQAVAQHDGSLIAVGGMGVIVQSQDGGISWQRTTLPARPFLVDVTVCPDGTFHAIDKTDGIWRLTADGLWTRQALPELTEPQAMTCDGAGVLWVVGAFSAILHSSNGGESWETWSLDEDLYLTTVQFVDQQYGFVTGEFGTVLLSTDNGHSWNRANDLPDGFYPQGAFFTSPTSGWIVGLSGTIWKTEDGGQSWIKSQSEINTPLYNITGFDSTLLAVGDNGTILYLRNGDPSWASLSNSVKSRGYLRGIAGLGGDRFIVTGGGGALFDVSIPEIDSQLREHLSGDRQ